MWCNLRNRFTQQLSPNHMSLKLEIKTLHSINLDLFGKSVKIAKNPFMMPSKSHTTDTLNCPDTAAQSYVTVRPASKPDGPASLRPDRPAS